MSFDRAEAQWEEMMYNKYWDEPNREEADQDDEDAEVEPEEEGEENEYQEASKEFPPPKGSFYFMQPSSMRVSPMPRQTKAKFTPIEEEGE